MFPIEPGGYMRTWGRLGPVGRRGARRFSCYHEVLFWTRRSFSRSWDHDWSPEAVNTWFSFRSRDRIRTLVYLGPEVAWKPGGTQRFLPYIRRKNPEVSSLDPEIADWNPDEPGGSSLDPKIYDWNPEAIGEPRGTVLRLPRQGYYLYLFGFRIMPLGSWPLSSSYDGDSFLSKLVSLLKDDFHLSYGSINHSAWKPHARGRTQNRGHGPRPGGRNPEPGSRTLE
ncbi:hypothetical protein F2Q70_00016803 [Brassica cretica]|uniref:Uncharacterized protein n=1 Tax=Brassica cretica TaxID=69181 RepID=A0A8S9I0L7_BRACR|nr:hypothetical protein F2Q70_00016803 [Brassica cretica]